MNSPELWLVAMLSFTSMAYAQAPLPDPPRAPRATLGDPVSDLTALPGLVPAPLSGPTATMPPYSLVEPTTAGDDALSKRVAELELELGKLREKLEKPAANVDKKPTAPTFKIGGRIHFDSWTFMEDSPGIGFFENPATGDDPANRVFFRRIRLETAGQIFEHMVYRLQVDFEEPNSPDMKDVYIGFEDLPILQTVLVGNQKRPLGLDHLQSSRFTIFIERPLVVEAFNEDARRIGIASYGNSLDEVYHWRYGAFMLENAADDGKVIGDAGQWSFNGRLSSNPWYENDGRDYLHLAVIGMVARPDGDASPLGPNANEARFRTRAELRSDERWLNTGRIANADWYEIAGVETIVNLGPMQILGEYQNAWVQRRDAAGGSDLFFHGAYVYVAYFLTGEHMPYDRKMGSLDRVIPFRPFSLPDCLNGELNLGAWQVALRLSYLDLSNGDIAGGVGRDLTLGLVWYINSHASFQLNFLYGEIDEHAPAGGFTHGHFTALGTRFRCDF